jgi:hypothetical protein
MKQPIIMAELDHSGQVKSWELLLPRDDANKGQGSFRQEQLGRDGLAAPIYLGSAVHALITSKGASLGSQPTSPP